MSPENERERARLRWRVALALCTLLIPAAAAAQEGTVSGTVTVAATGAPVAGAFVLLIGGDRDTETGADGRYTLSAAAGDYVVLVVAAGFRASEKTITVTAGGTVTADFALQAARAQFGEQVVVLGSRSSRTALETPVPVDVLTETDLEDTGQTETSRIIQFLAPSFNFSTSTISDGTDIVRPSTLRGLGPDQTLVLVNGKRRHNSALVHVNGSIGRGTAGVDLNAIPSSAIERIEILRDGAAAQYGSDAIAGVINIVLKSGTGTTKLDVSAGEHFEGDGETVQASVNRGWKIANGGFVNLTAELRDRGFTNRAGPDPRRIYAPLADGSPDPREATYDRLNHRYGDAESENGYLFLNGALPTGGDGELYFFGGVADRDGESAGFNRLPGQDRTNTLLWPDGHLPLINTSVDDFSFSVGHRGTVGGGWSYDAAVVTGNNEFNFFISNSANTSLWENSPTSADAGTLKFDQTTFTLDFFGTADWGLAAPVSVALGVEYREDGYEIEAGEPASYIDGGEPNQFCRPPWPQPDPRCRPAPAGIQVFPGFQ
ncbi:MAG: TonB-dependent receptor, partial [Thermoanaerobaculia bacterium]|nr:TonB-dependent receptor [Thermoanaerobaculia bacterium]